MRKCLGEVPWRYTYRTHLLRHEIGDLTHTVKRQKERDQDICFNAHTSPADLLRACLEALGIIPDVALVPVELGAPILPEEGRHVIYNQGSELYRTLLGA